MVNNSKLICSNCSVALPNNVRFCTECGSKIEGNTDTISDQKERTSKIENNSNINEPYQNPSDQPINDSIESLRESGKDFIRDIGEFLNKASSSSRSRPQSCPNCSAALPYGVSFCTECGNPIEPSPPTETNQIHSIKGNPENDEFDKLEYLEKLASLKDKGIISDEEFEKKKKEILKI